MCVYREPQVVRCGGSTVLNIIPEKEDRTLYIRLVGFHGGSPLQETRMPVRCRIVLVSMEKQGGCGISDPSLRGGVFLCLNF